MAGPSYFEQSKREMRIILCTWFVFCVWVVGYCTTHAYELDPENLSITFGMPSWVFWGIAAPWCCATIFTVVFGFRLLRDQPLEIGKGDRG